MITHEPHMLKFDNIYVIGLHIVSILKHSQSV